MWMAAAATVVGSLIQSQAAGSAADQASSAANRATDAQLQIFNKQNDQQAPWRQAGGVALKDILAGFGHGPSTSPVQWEGQTYANADAFRQALKAGYTNDPAAQQRETNDQNNQHIDQIVQQATDASPQTGGSGTQDALFNHQFNANDLNANLAPNWAFSLNQGIGATKNAGNLQTGLLSGNTLKGISDYTLNKSGDLYQQAFNNYTTNQSNIFNRLSTVAGFGSAANQQSAGLAGAMSPGIASSITNSGAAQAAGTIGGANALSGGVGNALGWYQLNNLLRPSAPASSGSNFAE